MKKKLIFITFLFLLFCPFLTRDSCKEVACSHKNLVVSRVIMDKSLKSLALEKADLSFRTQSALSSYLVQRLLALSSAKNLLIVALALCAALLYFTFLSGSYWYGYSIHSIFSCNYLRSQTLRSRAHPPTLSLLFF